MRDTGPGPERAQPRGFQSWILLPVVICLSISPGQSSQRGKALGAPPPRAQLPLSLGDITASQCRSHFKLISLCTMFFKSFLNKTEIQCLFLGCGNKDQVWGEKGASGVQFCSCLPHASSNQQSMSSPQPRPAPPPRNLRSMGGSLWQGFSGDRVHGAMAWDSCSSSVLAREKPDVNSITIVPGGLIWPWLFCFRQSVQGQS